MPKRGMRRDRIVIRDPAGDLPSKTLRILAMTLLQLLRGGLGVGAVACLSATASPPPIVPPNVCLTASADSFDYFGQLQKIASASDSISALQRQAYQLTQTTIGNTSRVTKENDCKKAGLVIDSIAGTPNSGRQVFLFKLGTSYGTTSPAYNDQYGSHTIFILNSSFKYKVHIALGG